MKNKIALLYTYLLKIKMFISTYVKKNKNIEGIGGCI